MLMGRPTPANKHASDYTQITARSPRDAAKEYRQRDAPSDFVCQIKRHSHQAKASAECANTRNNVSIRNGRPDRKLTVEAINKYNHGANENRHRKRGDSAKIAACANGITKVNIRRWTTKHPKVAATKGADPANAARTIKSSSIQRPLCGHDHVHDHVRTSTSQGRHLSLSPKDARYSGADATTGCLHSLNMAVKANHPIRASLRAVHD
jgi:hypothetical protein